MPIDLSQWTLVQFQSFLLILSRVTTILFMMPLLGSRNLPSMLKAGLSLVVALVLLPVVKVDPRLLPPEPVSVLFFMVGELMIGLVLGLSVKVIFTGLQMAGEIAGYQMGLAMASVIDPQAGSDNTLMAQFQYLFGLLLFLAVDGHHWFFRALVQSFEVLPPGGFHLNPGLYDLMIQLSGKMFVVAIKLAAPIMAVLLFTQIALGMVAKTVPQVNILFISFPITLSLGLIFLGLSLDLFLPYVQSLLGSSARGLVTGVLPLLK
jgi:flagellar biosynthetic protein FliR